ncbi:hypothetical protein [Streptomyces sp. BE230]|uniref:hypothetical protein n=1 Tax=Streptomyces sp. BE230 TaxID=3002526 RepID=UPI002ED16E46|nr:hypothetical protein [Streptomyces sp. BE230]
MRRTKWAAVAVSVAVIALGAAGCGTSDTDAEGAAAAPISTTPRPKGTGPLTKDVVRTDINTSAADAGIPANAPEWGRGFEDAPADSARSCSASFKGFGTEATPVDVDRHKTVVDELRERGWQQTRTAKERNDRGDRQINMSQAILKQRGWTVVATYRTFDENGVITLTAFEDACMKEKGADSGPVG